jgi:HSP20 family molecular chaperone IbpA
MERLVSYMSRELMREIGAKSRDIYEFISPPVDVFEDGSELVVVADLPGVQKADISVRLTEDTLTISAKREPAEHMGPIHWQQRPVRFHKRVPLPVQVQVSEEVEAQGTFENGVLTLRLPLTGVGRVRIA